MDENFERPFGDEIEAIERGLGLIDARLKCSLFPTVQYHHDRDVGESRHQEKRVEGMLLYEDRRRGLA